MPKNSSAKYYQDYQKKTTKKTHGRYQSLRNEKKNSNMVVNDTSISQKIKNKIWLSKEKKYYKKRRNALFQL